MVTRGEIWLAALDPTVGTEIQKTRPVLVVSPDDLNAYLRLVTIIPLTSGSHPAPFRIPLQFAGRDGLLLLEQVRSVDKRRLIKLLGQAEQSTLRQALAALRTYYAD
ncbi:type II toxin-antitoxin system PemK/MazF family toxin [Devosia ginsengisoli]|uniref:type II toxin-antitoxin system PemK/MazF family toxin n=1 Tax=Devosia ginsengisoli TaxID=400770 RepID=UPI0026F09FE2|nr:type II toxin-antitoxin system PemK/MazF family toxin [Devosia ginsengisoli]MCR6670286.1 type II toxin-antitoxin system PemK/MazF family toxin [Devosia ginsengisoli]